MQPYVRDQLYQWTQRTYPGGGIIGYPLASLYEEVAFIAYHFHWSLTDILNLEHGDRRYFVEQISAINRRMNESADPSQGISLSRLAGLGGF